MTTDRPDWTDLNAYVDGELSPHEAAQVARAAGEDPEIAGQISLLYKLKADTQDAVPPAPADLAEMLAAPARRKRRLPFARIVAVAALVGALALLPNWLAAPSKAPDGSLIATVRTVHAQWLGSDTGTGVASAPVVLDALARFGRLPMLPDLASTGLDIASVSVIDMMPGKLLHVGYRGHHGCHLSLFVAAGGALPALPAAGAPEAEQLDAWNVADLSYLLYALGMDQGRFDLIAQKVEGATRAFAPLGASDREQLAANARAASHCRV